MMDFSFRVCFNIEFNKKSIFYNTYKNLILVFCIYKKDVYIDYYK